MVIAFAFIGSMLGVYLVEIGDVASDVFPLINAMLCVALGIPLFFSINILLEKEKLSGKYAALIYGLAAVVLVATYFSLPDQETTQNTFQPYIRYAIYNVCLHLLVTVLPFIYDRDTYSFWNYTITLFIRLLAALLYSMILFIGVVLALLALHLLFDLDFDESIYLQLFILFMGLFNTWFFLSGIPENVAQNKGVNPPLELKGFTQKILLPLLSIYLLILYGYGAKIMLIWDWPRGIVSYLIICVAVLGIGTFLLLYPYGQLKGNNWIRKATRAFYWLMIPLLAVLFIAIRMRMEDYGITVNRYLIGVLGIWILITCLYFIFGKRNIKFIPLSLAIVFFLASFGPWGMFVVSERSQVHRLRDILSQANILAGNQIKNEIIWDNENLPQFDASQPLLNNSFLSDSLYSEVSSIFYYLDDYHGFNALEDWFSQDMDSILSAVNRDKLRWQRIQEPQLYMQTIGLKYPPGPGNASTGFYSFEADLQQTASALQGYDYLVDFNIGDNAIREFSVNGRNYQLQIDHLDGALILINGQDTTLISLEPMIRQLIKDSREDQNHIMNKIAPSKMRYVDEKSPGLKLEIHQISFQYTPDKKIQLEFISGFLLIHEH